VKVRGFSSRGPSVTGKQVATYPYAPISKSDLRVGSGKKLTMSTGLPRTSLHGLAKRGVASVKASGVPKSGERQELKRHQARLRFHRSGGAFTGSPSADRGNALRRQPQPFGPSRGTHRTPPGRGRGFSRATAPRVVLADDGIVIWVRTQT
jgi:hypothetical protein